MMVREWVVLISGTGSHATSDDTVHQVSFEGLSVARMVAISESLSSISRSRCFSSSAFCMAQRSFSSSNRQSARMVFSRVVFS